MEGPNGSRPIIVGCDFELVIHFVSPCHLRVTWDKAHPIQPNSGKSRLS
jgi:hypothetical protein